MLLRGPARTVRGDRRHPRQGAGQPAKTPCRAPVSQRSEAIREQEVSRPDGFDDELATGGSAGGKGVRLIGAPGRGVIGTGGQGATIDVASGLVMPWAARYLLQGTGCARRRMVSLRLPPPTQRFGWPGAENCGQPRSRRSPARLARCEDDIRGDTIHGQTMRFRGFGSIRSHSVVAQGTSAWPPIPTP